MYWQIRGLPLDPQPKYAVSVLIPTRGRPKKLKRALLSLYENVQKRELVEILLRVDNDDVETQTVLRSFLPSFPIQTTIIVGPRGNGYLDIHHHLHLMAQTAGGHWLFVFNDDAVMLTQDWDQWFDASFAECHNPIDDGNPGQVWVDDIWLVIPEGVNNPSGSDFFAVTKKTFEILGHLGLNMGVDLWLTSVFTSIQRLVRMSHVKISHQEERDKTYNEGKDKIKGDLLFDLVSSNSVIRDRLQDSMTLISYIEEFTHNPEGLLDYMRQPDGIFISYKKYRGLIKLDHHSP